MRLLRKRTTANDLQNPRKMTKEVVNYKNNTNDASKIKKTN